MSEHEMASQAVEVSGKLGAVIVLLLLGLLLGVAVAGLQVLGMLLRRARLDRIDANLRAVVDGQRDIRTMQGVVNEWAISARNQAKEAALAATAVKEAAPRSESEVLLAVGAVPERTAVEVRKVLDDSDPLKVSREAAERAARERAAARTAEIEAAGRRKD